MSTHSEIGSTEIGPTEKEISEEFNSLLHIPLDKFNGTKFEYPESTGFEYKKSIIKLCYSKYVETICAMLNVDGGYMIFGICDDLSLEGLVINSKFYDEFLRFIDGLYEQGIVECVNDKASKLSIGSLTVTNITNSNNKKFVIIKILNKSGRVYKLINGKTYYRLNASNFMYSDTKIYKDYEMLHQKEQINRQHAIVIKTILKEKTALSVTYKKLEAKKTELEKELEDKELKILNSSKMIEDLKYELENKGILQIVKDRFLGCFDCCIPKTIDKKQ